jgi:aspartyl-tRNA(Asn)/glutamyl-tRNA(Gln) amidotransferase subunit A
MQLTSLTLSEVISQYRRGVLSPVELTRAYLERIHELDPRINAFITVTDELALQQARQAEEDLGRGETLSPLHGVPIALKDLYDTQGICTTAGSKIFRERIPTQNAAVVDKLYAAGAILLGKLNMHEFALGVTNANPHFGACHNPWDLERSPGGSSGGSGAALAAGMCLGSLGSDTGGSIRIPAALCGIVGLKPTRGRVSTRGVVPLSWNLDHAGPMGRRVLDTALLLNAIAGYDPDDPYSVNVPVDDYVSEINRGIKGWRVALATGDFFRENVHPEVIAAMDAAVDVFEELGAVVKAVAFPDARRAGKANGLITPSDAAAFHRERMQTNAADIGEDVLKRLRIGAAYTSTEYILARHTQSVLRRQYDQFFEDYDILLTPATPVPAPSIAEPDAIKQAAWLTRFTAPFNLTGLPAISLPCGFTEGGLPIGIQIVARRWGEATLLQAAQAYEGATLWHTYEPLL